MEAEINCDVCGGTNFYKEAGFFYCTECQTQTQEIRDQVIDAELEPKRGRKLKTKEHVRKRSEPVITSWECYNYILLGLVNELIDLGAHENLKATVEALWLKYLRTMEVIGKSDARPKLSAVNSTVDAEIVFGRKITKRRRSRSVSPSNTISNVSSSDIGLLNKDRSRKKKALVKATYDEYTSTQQSDVSLANETLTSLKSNTEGASKNTENYLQYNRFASKELRKVMKKSHLTAHRHDVNSTLTCHKLTYRKFRTNYLQGPEVLSRNKLYSLIYLGLLINKDKIQLGDMLRFVREGHLSYEHVHHFFPEDFDRRRINIRSFSAGNTPLSNYYMRVTSCKMAVLLNVAKYVPVQNLVEMCERYCVELNLPDEICKYVLLLISETSPRMNCSLKSKIIPNYEGRVISLIIFALKLFFGLDGETEYHFSTLSSQINDNLIGGGTKMFNFKMWLQYIEYRKLVMTEVHFPSESISCDADRPHLFNNFMNDYNSKFRVEKDVNVELEVVKILIEKVRSYWGSMPGSLKFSHSLTPFHDYTEFLLNPKVSEKFSIEILNNDFKSTSLDFLIHTRLYLEALDPDIAVEYEHRGLNDRIKFLDVFNRNAHRFKRTRQEKKMHNVTLSKKVKMKQNVFDISDLSDKTYVSNSEETIESFETYHAKTYKKNLLRTEESCKSVVENVRKDNVKLSADHIDNKIYNPAERFWLHTNDVSQKPEEEFHTFISRFPLCFQAILQECSRITEQTEKDLFVEYNTVELYLCYSDMRKDKVCDQELRKLICNALKVW